MIEIKTFVKPKKTGGSSGSSSSTKYISGVISEAEHAARADKAKRAEVADQANYAGTAASAQNAAYASEAGNLHEDAEILQQYLSLKDTVDPQVVNGMVIFAKGLMVNLLAQLKGGASFGSDGLYSFDKDGNLVIESAQSRDFDEMLQNGFALKRNPTSGKCTLSISDLIVWGRMVINTLEIRKKYAIGGNVYLSGASSKIQHVEKVYSEDGETVVGYKCYILKDDGTMATQNNWVVGDQALCQTFDIEEGVYQNVSNQYYWRLVTQVSEENVAITEKYTDKDGNEQIRELYEGQKFAWIVLSKDDCDTNSGIPASGDTIVLDGHRLTENEDTDYTERTNVLMLEATGSGSPRIIALTGVVDYKHTTDNEVFILSPQKVIFTTEHFEIRTAAGAPITFVHFMGPWVKDTEYHYYDQVSHANALWTCIVEKGKSTTAEPTDGSTYWRKEMSGGKGEKGDDAVSYTLEASPGYIRLSSDGSIDYTNGYIDKGDEYGSDKYLVVRGYKVAKGVRDNRFSTEANPVTLRLTINDGSAYSEYTPSDGDSVSIDFEPKYEDSYYSMLEEISHSGLNSVRVDMCEGSEYNPNKILATLDIPITQSGEGVVMAYKNATSQPSKPTVEDLSQLSDGWSRTPQKGGSYNKVSNISYGNYSVDNTTSGYNTSEWSEVSDSGETWRKSPSGLSDSYGWAIMKVSFSTNVDNLDVKAIIKAYSEANFDFIQVHELDTEITGSNDLRKKGVAYISGNGIETSYSYHVATAGQHFFYVSYCKDSSGKANGDYGLFRFDLSDNLTSIPSTVWMSQATLKDGKAILPWSTPVKITGEDGEDAYRVEVSPATLVFDTGDNGLVDSATLSGEYATVTVYKGNQKISANNLSLPSNNEQIKRTNVNGKISNVEGEARITITKIVSETVSEDVTVSKSSGQISFPIDVFGERNTLMWATVNVQVNVSKFTGQMINTNKQFSKTLTEVSNKVDDKVGSSELTQFKAEIEQTAREISLSVSEKTIGRRNLLIGSAARKYGEGWLYMSSGSYYNDLPCESISINGGINGVNAILCRTKRIETNSYYLCGYRWNGNSQQGNIKLEKGKTYYLSFYGKTASPSSVYFVAEVLYEGSKTDTSRPSDYAGPIGYTTTFSASASNTWTLFTAKIEMPSNAPYEYVEVNIFARARTYTVVEAYLCKPMLEEGDTYGGWTLSEQDYGYVGGNLLDNARTLAVGGNLTYRNGTLLEAGYGDCNAIRNFLAYGSTQSDISEILIWDFNSSYLTLGKDYILSFLAKCESEGGRIVLHLWSKDNENAPSAIFVECSSGEIWWNHIDGNVAIELSTEWRRYWVHWRPLKSGYVPRQLIIRHTGYQNSAGSCPATNVYITQPKLEEGATLTEYTERKSDLIDKASLKAAGVLINSESVTLYGSQVHIKKDKNDTNDTVLIDNNTGKVSAGLINAEKVVAEGIATQNLEATNLKVAGNSKFGIWEIVKDDTFGEMIQARGDLTLPSGTTASGSGINYLPLYIRGGIADINYFRVGVSCTEFSYCYGNDFCGVWTGKAADYVCGGTDTVFNTPTGYDYNASYHPAGYIYAKKSSSNDPAFAINVQSSGTAGERLAIQTNGAIRGVEALNIETIWTGKQISSGIGAVRCVNTSEITIYLPVNPVIGQKFYVLQEGSGKVNITGDSNHQIIKFNKGIVTTCNSNCKGQISIFIWSGGYWFGSFFNGIF